MNNYKLKIQYDGTDFAGWQIQKNALSIQQKISDSIEVLLKERVNLIGSGRTDSGVHALGQISNFKTNNTLDFEKFNYSLNSILPSSISVLDIDLVPESFHARFDAKKRSYIYLIANEKSPFYYNYSWFYPQLKTFDLKTLNNLSKSFLGEHDFTSLSRKNSEIENKVCTVYSIHWRRSGQLTVFYIEANRFLHGMVRTIIGTLISAVKNKLTSANLLDIINQKERELAGEAVPAKGLFLFKVKYKYDRSIK